jgi:hypothetical protein
MEIRRPARRILIFARKPPEIFDDFPACYTQKGIQ